VAIAGEYRFPTKFFGKPGHQLFGATWSSRDVAALGQDPRIILPQVPINRTDGSWSVYYNFDQYLFMDPCDPKKGWGVFGRAGLADDRNNPVAWFLSLGVGGDSPISGRKNDTFGAGWYYSGTSDEIGPVLNNLAGGVGDGQGIELFYNYQVTPSFHLTPDMQIIMPARQQIDTAILLGLRGVITL
jgi:porin